jgi:hypothetical protein
MCIELYENLNWPMATNMIKEKKQKINKDYPRITIERYGIEDDGHISFIDIHDEKFGSAIFFARGSEHTHGFMNQGVYNKKKWI